MKHRFLYPAVISMIIVCATHAQQSLSRNEGISVSVELIYVSLRCFAYDNLHKFGPCRQTPLYGNYMLCQIKVTAYFYIYHGANVVT